MDDTTKPYRNKIKAVRHLLHLTQQDMADRLGYHDVKEYGRIETGEKRLELKLLESIAEVFGMNVMNLLGFNEQAALDNGNGTVDDDNRRQEGVEKELAMAHERIKHLVGEVEFLRAQLKEAMKRET